MVDRELVAVARAGEAAGVAALLARHRAAMRAAATAIVGPGNDVDDVVQDASIVAVRSISQLRDPDKARPWLLGITRNLAYRARVPNRTVPTDVRLFADAADAADAEIEGHVMRDWIWHALEGLPSHQRDVVVLRYFSTFNSYADIAQVLAIPIGTVRSRLSDARAALLHALALLDARSHPDHGHLERARVAFFQEVVAQYNRGDDLEVLRTALRPDARLTSAVDDDVIGGQDIIASLDSDLVAGVGLQLLRVSASSDMTVVEAAFRNPHDDPDHCPPLTTQVFRHRGEAISAIHLLYSDE